MLIRLPDHHHRQVTALPHQRFYDANPRQAEEQRSGAQETHENMYAAVEQIRDIKMAL